MIEHSSFLMIPPMVSGVVLILIIFSYKWTFKSKQGSLWIGVAVFLVFYSFIVGNAAVSSIRYQKELEKFDLNQDGFFSKNEITPEQEAAMYKCTNDLGRNLSVFTGAFISGILGLFSYLIAWGFGKYKRLKIGKKNKHNNVYHS